MEKYLIDCSCNGYTITKKEISIFFPCDDNAHICQSSQEVLKETFDRRIKAEAEAEA